MKNHLSVDAPTCDTSTLPKGGGPLTDQVALVTGGASGIGLATARALARRGCRLLLAGRSADRLQEAERVLPGARSLVCDVRDAAAVDRMFDFASRELGPPEIVVLSAGIARSSKSAHHVPQAIAQLEEDVFDDIVDTNLRGVFVSCRAAARAMVGLGRGQIVHVSSARAGRRGLAYGVGYCASKRAATALVDALAGEVAPHGIRVFSFFPDVVETAMIAATGLAKQGALDPDDVGEFIARLLEQPRELTIDGPSFYPAPARGKARAAQPS